MAAMIFPMRVSTIIAITISTITALLVLVLIIVLIIVLADATGSGTDVAGVANVGLFAISLIKFVESQPAFLSIISGAPIFLGAPFA